MIKNIKIKWHKRRLAKLRNLEGRNVVRKNIKHINKLRNLGIEGLDLHESYLKGAILGLRSFENFDFSYANLEWVDFSSSDLNGSKLLNAKMKNACLERASFQDVQLGGVDFRGAVLIRTDFRMASFENSGSQLAKAYISQKQDFINAGCTSDQLKNIEWINDPMIHERELMPWINWLSGPLFDIDEKEMWIRSWIDLKVMEVGYL